MNNEALKKKGLDGTKVFASKLEAKKAAEMVVGALGKCVAENFDSGQSSQMFANATLVFTEKATGVTCLVVS